MENPSLAYCEALMKLAAERPDVVLVTADSADPIGLTGFRDAFPGRFFDVGIAEQAMTNVAAGMASTGLMPFVSSFAMFQALRAADNVRNGVAYPGLNVKMVAANVGLNVGKNGVTHHALEDLAVMRAIPGMTVLSPADAPSVRTLVPQMADWPGPVYMRIDKVPIPTVYPDATPLRIGRGQICLQGDDVAILATGSTVHTALEAAHALDVDGISAAVVDVHTLKPLDEELVVDVCGKTRAVVTVEPHSIIGGLGGAVAELLSSVLPMPLERVGVRDVFTESGDASALHRKYGLTADVVVAAVQRVLGRRLA